MASITVLWSGTDPRTSVARVVMLQTHADFLNLPLATKANNHKGLSEPEMHKYLVNYLDYNTIDDNIGESWRLRRQAQESYEKLKAATEELVHCTARSEGFLSHVFSHEVAPAGSLREVGQKFTKDLLAAGYSEIKTAATLYSLASSGVAPIAGLVRLLSTFFSNMYTKKSCIVCTNHGMALAPRKHCDLGQNPLLGRQEHVCVL